MNTQYRVRNINLVFDFYFFFICRKSITRSSRLLYFFAVNSAKKSASNFGIQKLSSFFFVWTSLNLIARGRCWLIKVTLNSQDTASRCAAGRLPCWTKEICCRKHELLRFHPDKHPLSKPYTQKHTCTYTQKQACCFYFPSALSIISSTLTLGWPGPANWGTESAFSWVDVGHV